MHRRVVVDEQLSGLAPQLGDLAAVMTVAVIVDRERTAEAVPPAISRVHLLGARNSGDVIVLDPGQMPEQPADRVGTRVDPLGQLSLVKPVGNVRDGALNSFEGIDQ